MSTFDVLNLADAGFPTGAHGHSSGLEYAIQARWVWDRSSFAAWCRTAAAGSIVPFDLRAALKAWYIGDGPDAPWLWSQLGAEVASFRTSRVQREASGQVGRSFLRSAMNSYGHRLGVLPEMTGAQDVQFPVAWGAVFRSLGLEADAMARTFVFGALRQWVQVAVRIIPLGQNDAFGALTEVLAQIPMPDPSREEASKPLESLAPGLDLAALGTENLVHKYFRS